MDIITYALSKKIAAHAVSGVQSMSVNGQTLTINTKDSGVLTMTFPTPKDGVSVIDIDVNANNQIVFTMSDGSEFISGKIPTVKGDPGVSPIITENADNTDKIYKLDITTVDSTFTTPNLKGADGQSGTGGSGEENTIESISVNGKNVPPDKNKNVDIEVPNIYVGDTEPIDNNIEVWFNPSGESSPIEVPIEKIKVNGELQTPVNKVVDIPVPDAYDDTALSNRVKAVEDEVPNLATKTYVGEQIANAEHLKREIVTVLPSDTEASDNIIYMLKVESATGNDKYQEYMKIDGTVQMVGDTSVDLADYAKTVDIPTTVAELTDSSSYAKKTDIPATLPANGGNADTVNNHTVKSDVPENAVFTDTVYDDTEVKGSIEGLNEVVRSYFYPTGAITDIEVGENGAIYISPSDGFIQVTVSGGTDVVGDVVGYASIITSNPANSVSLSEPSSNNQRIKTFVKKGEGYRVYYNVGENRLITLKHYALV